MIYFSCLDKPSKPTGPLEASDITDHTMTVSWKPPATDGGSPVKNYVVHKKEEGQDWTTGAFNVNYLNWPLYVCIGQTTYVTDIGFALDIFKGI